MGITYYVPDITKGQAKGPDLSSGNLNWYGLNKRNPVNMLFLGGHETNDAPTYDRIDGETAADRGLNPISGRHVETIRRIGPSTIRSISQVIVPPAKLVPQIENLRKKQERGDRYNFALMPHLNCEARDAFAYVAREGMIDDWEFTTAISGWADNSVEIGRQYNMTSSGQYMLYLGLTFTELVAAAGEDLYVVGRVEAACAAEAGGCPHQIAFAAGGSTGTPFTGYAAHTDDQFANDTTINLATVIAAGQLITSGVYFNGNYIFGLADAVGAAATAGGFAYSADGAAAVLSLGVTSTGIQQVLVIGTNVYGFGNTGEVWVSENSGVTWTLIVSGITEDILDADYDADTGVVYLAATAAKAYSWDLTSFVDLAAAGRITPTAATALTAVAVVAPNHVAFGGANGNFYESFLADTENFTITQAFGANIGAIKGDGIGLRVVVGVTTSVRVRDVVNRQEWTTVTETLAGNVTDIERGDLVTGEGMNFFWMVTDTGEIAKLDTYYECVAD